MGGIRGDFRKLAQLAGRLGALGSKKAELHAELAETAKTLVQQGFDRGIDPLDQPWAPLKSRKGRPLRDTGRLMNSYTATVTSRGIAVGTNVVYAPPHQFGAFIHPHTRLRGRYQAVDGRGRFRKHAGRMSKSVHIRFLSGGTYGNGISIPARPMIPAGEPGERWKRALRATTSSWFKRQVGA